MSKETLGPLWEDYAKPLMASSGQELLSLREYEGVLLWPVLKSALIMTLLNQHQAAPLGKLSPVAQSLFKKVKSKFRTQLSRLPSNLDVSQNEFDLKIEPTDVICLGNIGPTLKRESGIYNPHFDPLRSALAEQGKSSLALYYDVDTVGLQFGQSSASLKSNIDMAVSNATARVASMQDLTSIFERLQGNSQIRQLGVKLTAEFFTHRVAVIIECRAFFRTLFEAHPETKSILITNYYNPIGWGALYAAHEHGVRRIDIQHGVQGCFHHAYTGFQNTVDDARPDGFLCWDARSAQNIDEQLGGGHTKIIGLSAVRAAESDMMKPDRDSSLRHVCLFLQYTETQDWLTALRAALPDTIKLGVRRHPGALKLGHFTNLPQGCESRDTDDMATLLLSLDLAVTGYSSSALEAEEFGVPVIAYSPLAPAFLDAGRVVTPITYASPEPQKLAQAILANLEITPRAEPKMPNVPDLGPIAEWILPTA